LPRPDRIPRDGILVFEIVNEFVGELVRVFEIAVVVFPEKSPGGIEYETLSVIKNAANTAKIILNKSFENFINLFLR
jgi:hypothetical protein